jgi:hypothetical protein
MTRPPAARLVRLRFPLAFLLALGGASPAREAPNWVVTPPVSPGRIYGVGGATPGASDAEALERATEAAKVQVLAFLSSGLHGRLRRWDILRERQAAGKSTTFSREAATREETQLDVSATDLPGLVVAERALDRPGHAAYALAYLDCAVAEQALTGQVLLLQAEGSGLLQEPPGAPLPAALGHLRGIRSLRDRCALLTRQADLLQAAGIPPGIRADLQRLATDLDQASAALQHRLTVGARAPAHGLGPEVQAILHTTSARLGFGWSNENPALPLGITIRSGQGPSGGPLVPYPADPGDPELIGLRATVRISLLDANGTVQDGFDLPVRGIGIDPATALLALEQALERELPARFQAFLEQAR